MFTYTYFSAAGVGVGVGVGAGAASVYAGSVAVYFFGEEALPSVPAVPPTVEPVREM